MTSRPRLTANYYRLFGASVVSNLGDGISGVAYPWLASAVTRSGLHIALIGMMPRIPWLIFSLPAGVITDRFDRRRLIAAMQGLRFVLTLFVAIIVMAFGADLSDPAAMSQGAVPGPANAGLFLVVLYVSGLLFGFAEVLADNAAQTMMPATVEPELLEKANGRLWGAEMIMNSFVGPPLGGILIATAFALPFFTDAATFAIAGALVLTMTGTYTARDAKSGKIEWRAEIAQGVRWLWQHRLLRSMGLILGVMNALLTLSMATVVLFVQEILGLEANAFGLLLTGFAVGGVAGSLLAPAVSRLLGAGTALFVVLGGLGVQLAGTGATSSWVVVYILAVFGSFLGVVWNVITVSLRQTIIPDDLLGRVNSVYRLFAWGMMPLGSLAAGVIVTVTESATTRELALRMPFFVGGAVSVALLLYALPILTTKNIEEARAGSEAARQAPDDHPTGAGG